METKRNNFRKIARLTQLSFLAIIVCAICIMAYNQFVGVNYLSNASKQVYMFNALVANSNGQFTFDKLSTILTQVFLLKDSIVIIALILTQLVFILLVGSMRKREKGYFKYAFAVIFHFLTLGVAIGNIVLNGYLNINIQFLQVEAIMLLVITLVQTLLLGYLLYCYISFKPIVLKELLSKGSFQNFAYKTIRNASIFLGVILVTLVTVALIAYQALLFIIAQLSLQDYFPGAVYYDLTQIVSNQSDAAAKILSSVTYNQWFISLKSGTVTLDLSLLDYKIHTIVTDYVSANFSSLIQPILIILGFYIIVNIINYIYKRTQFKHDIVLAVLALVTFLRPFYAVSINNVLFRILDTLIIIAVIIYIVHRIDDRFFNGELSKLISNAMNDKILPEIKSFINSFKKNKSDDKDQKNIVENTAKETIKYKENVTTAQVGNDLGEINIKRIERRAKYKNKNKTHLNTLKNHSRGRRK